LLINGGAKGDNNLKNVLVLSGGTATAWNICNAFKKVGSSEVKLIVCDINPSWLVHSSALADVFLEVPPINSPGYYEHMLSIFKEYQVDIVVPLIDMDIRYFSRCNKDLKHLGIFSTAPQASTFDALANKKNLHKTLSELGLGAPRIFSVDEIEDNIEYFVKPIIGYGSRNALKLRGQDIKRMNLEDLIVQELCDPVELTADVFTVDSKVKCLCRERLETKAGVCTKARIFYDPEVEQTLQKIANHITLPEISCVQFMKNKEGKWVITDFNLRLGAGSALSAAVGFDIAQSAVAHWLNMPQKMPLRIPDSEHYVVRYYQELVTK